MNPYRIEVLAPLPLTALVVREQFCWWARARGSAAKTSFPIPSSRVSVDGRRIIITGTTKMSAENVREAEMSLAAFMQNNEWYAAREAVPS